MPVITIRFDRQRAEQQDISTIYSNNTAPMTSEDYFHQVFSSLPRQGPGYSDATRKAWSLIPSLPPRPDILDIGCGTGTQTRDLANLTEGTITAVDNYEPFIERITEWSKQEGVSQRIRTLQASMDDLPFDQNEFDIIRSEGAVDIMGFEKGVSQWKEYCKNGGYMVVSDMTLFDSPAPEELIDFWKPYGVTVCTEEEKSRQISNAGLQLLSLFRLEEKGWLEHYYDPMQKVIEKLRKDQGDVQECAGVLNALEQEAGIYRKFGKFYGYTFFVMQKP